MKQEEKTTMFILKEAKMRLLTLVKHQDDKRCRKAIGRKDLVSPIVYSN